MRLRRSPCVVSGLIGSMLALTACAPDSAFVQSEAGAELSTTGFGAPTLNNQLVQSGAKDATNALALRFAEEVPSTITFDFNSARLDAAAQAALRQQADWIRQFPEVRFRVYGHTDLVGSSSYNNRLGLRRAQAVLRFLGTQGISRSRLEAVASFGETRPVVQTANPERRNRRTVTEVTGFVQGAAGPLDGKFAAIIYRDYVNSAGQQSTVEAADSE